jgi:hypothetical protein
MSFEQDYWGKTSAEVQATMQEEGCAGCFGCPYATEAAAVISSMADQSQDLTGAFMAVERKFQRDHARQIGKALLHIEETQENYRQKLRELTTPCVGWIGDVGTDTASHQGNTCNNPGGGDHKISLAARWLLNKLARRGTDSQSYAAQQNLPSRDQK